MRAGFRAAIRLASCAAALGLAACTHDPDTVLSGALTPMERQAETAVYAEAPPAEGDWDAPVVHADYGGSPAATEASGPYLLDTGDKLRVFVYGQPNLSRAYTVDHDGTITVPLINEVRARGRTIRDLEEIIAQRLGAEFVRDPQVTVDILQNRPFFIYGEVRTGGQYPYVSGMTVETAIAIAGGFSDRASTRSFRVTRRHGGLADQIEVAGDFSVLPGDVIYVNERFF